MLNQLDLLLVEVLLQIFKYVRELTVVIGQHTDPLLLSSPPSTSGRCS